jgi:hypothetical protein
MELPNFMDINDFVDLYNSNEISDEMRGILDESLSNEGSCRGEYDSTPEEMIRILEDESKEEAKAEPFAHVKDPVKRIALRRQFDDIVERNVRKYMRNTVSLVRTPRQGKNTRSRNHRPAARKTAVTTGGRDDSSGSSDPSDPEPPAQKPLNYRRKFNSFAYRGLLATAGACPAGRGRVA